MHRRWLFVSAAAALVVASLIVGFLSGNEADADRAETTPSADISANITPPTGSPTASPSATGTSAKPSAKSTPRKKSPRATPTPTRPAADSAQRAGSAAAPSAGRIKPGTTYQGVATFYDSDGTGACLYDASDDVMTAAMNHTDYESSKACGAYVLVRAANGASVTVRVTNECPGGECAPGHLDLSAQAFAKLAQPSAGRIPITWKLVSPGEVGPLSIRYKTGSTRYWCGVQAIGHRNPVARLELRSGSGWRQLPRTEYNYFVSDDGSGCGGAIRITDIFGEQLTVDGIGIRPDTVQPTRVQFARR